MAGYTLIGSASIVQVLSPQSIADMVATTIQTQPTGIVATMLVSQAEVNAGTAASVLQQFADGIEQVIADGKAVGGAGTSDLDASGLQQYFVTFEVAYNPPGAPTGSVTIDVDVPALLLARGDLSASPTPVQAAELLIAQAYNNLVSLSGNTPASGTGTGGILSPPPPQTAPV